ncbi:MAG: hypothetical protein JWM51_209 [Microbacteriaceae bacterium]|jgi:hypothetical protein|nr:hypothetical protein [Microbacteriaceae bacterium]
MLIYSMSVSVDGLLNANCETGERTVRTTDASLLLPSGRVRYADMFRSGTYRAGRNLMITP